MRNQKFVEMAALLRFPVHVEAQICDTCVAKQDDIVALVTEKLKAYCPVFQNGHIKFNETDDVHDYCDHVIIGDMEAGKVISFWQAELCVHAFRLSDQEPEVRTNNVLLTSFVAQLQTQISLAYVYQRRSNNSIRLLQPVA